MTDFILGVLFAVGIIIAMQLVVEPDHLTREDRMEMQTFLDELATNDLDRSITSGQDYEYYSELDTISIRPD